MARATSYIDKESATIGLRRGTVETAFYVHESNIQGEKLRLLTGASDVAVDVSNFREHSWEVSMAISDPEEFDYVSGYVVVEMELGVSGSDEPPYVYPMGHYKLADRGGAFTDTETMNLTGRSLEDWVRKSYVADGYAVPAGAGCLNAARVLLIDRGIPASRIIFPVEDVLLPTDLFFDPVVDPSGCWRLSMVNTLLNAGGFYSLYADSKGNLTTKKIEEFEEKTPAVFYTSHFGDGIIHPRGVLVGEDFITTAAINYNYNSDNFANSVTVVSQDSQETTPIIVTEQNTDPESPLSIMQIGEVAAEPIQVQGVSGEAEARLIAKQALARMSGVYYALSLDTVVDPRRGLKEVLALKVKLPKRGSRFGEKVPVFGRFQVESFKTTETGTSFNVNRIELGYLDSRIEALPLEDFDADLEPIYGYGERGPIQVFISWGQDTPILSVLNTPFERLS